MNPPRPLPAADIPILEEALASNPHFTGTPKADLANYDVEGYLAGTNKLAGLLAETMGVDEMDDREILVSAARSMSHSNYLLAKPERNHDAVIRLRREGKDFLEIVRELDLEVDQVRWHLAEGHRKGEL